MDFNIFPTVASIMAICFLAGLYAKKLKLDQWIPCIVGTLGGILGVVGMYIIPEFPAGNVLDAIAVGIASGLAATGAHQIFKQLSNKEDNTPPDKDYTWEQYQSDKGKITFPAHEDKTKNGQS